MIADVGSYNVKLGGSVDALAFWSVNAIVDILCSQQLRTTEESPCVQNE